MIAEKDLDDLVAIAAANVLEDSARYVERWKTERSKPASTPHAPSYAQSGGLGGDVIVEIAQLVSLVWDQTTAWLTVNQSNLEAGVAGNAIYHAALKILSGWRDSRQKGPGGSSGLLPEDYEKISEPLARKISELLVSSKGLGANG
jgi:hypothetical protein